MESLFIPHQLIYDSAITEFDYETNNNSNQCIPRNGQLIAVSFYRCVRCGFIIQIKDQDVLKNILLLTQSTCELKYEQVQELLSYMAVKETHET